MSEINKIKFSDILSLVKEKSNRFGKFDYVNRACRKKQTKTRIELVYRLTLLKALLNYAKMGYIIKFESNNDSNKIMFDALIAYANDCRFERILSAFIKKAKNSQVNNETLLLEISQMVLFGECSKNLHFFFFEDEKINFSPLMHDFNKETMDLKQAKRKELYKKSIEYQKINKEAINKYHRDKNKTRTKLIPLPPLIP